MSRTGHFLLPLILIVVSSAAESQTLSVPNEFVAGQPAVAAEVNANFDEVELYVNQNRDSISALSQPPDLTSIEYLSWFHEGSMPLSKLKSFGLVVAFSRLVQTSDILDGFAGQNFVVELYRFNDGNDVWQRVSDISLNPVSDFTVASDERIDNYLIDSSDPAVTEAIVIFPPADYQDSGIHRVVIRGNFIRDEDGRIVDGEFVGARLPTGDVAQGGRFESWVNVNGN